MNEKPLDRVRKLVNLASSANLKEAERAAYKACALIREHGLDIVDPAEIDGIYQEQAALQEKVRQLEAVKPPSPDLDDSAFDAIVNRQAGQLGVRMRNYSDQIILQHLYRPVVRDDPDFDPTVSSHSRTRMPTTGPVTITAKYDGVCLQCRHHHQAGDQIKWEKGVPKGVWCASTSCYNDWHAGKKATADFNPFGP